MPAPRPPLDTCDNDADVGACLFQPEFLIASSSILAEPLPDAHDGELLPPFDDGSFATATDVGSIGKRKKTQSSIKKPVAKKSSRWFVTYEGKRLSEVLARSVEVLWPDNHLPVQQPRSNF